MRRPLLLVSGLFPVLAATRADAHASEQGFVLLLPTGWYAASGVAVILLTLALTAMLPARAFAAAFRPVPLGRARPSRGAGPWPSLLSALILAAALWQGRTGPQDPTANLLPLLVWTAFWLMLVPAQAVLGDLWRGLNPWTGPWQLLGRPAPLRYPRRLGHWPALAGLIAFAGFLLADIAPAAPERLARAVAAYWAFTFAGLCLFGPRWLLRAEALTVLTRAYAHLSPMGRHRGRVALGLPGWRQLTRAAPPLSLALFMITMLAVGSFDGVNETFLWLHLLGQNPLEFTGRSAVITPTLIGLLAFCAGLAAIFAAALALGQRLSNDPGRLRVAVRAQAPALLPIALGYHVAHYLPSLLVEGQYLLIRLNDPFLQGWHLLGMDHPHVTTGFFNTTATVRLIYAAQAGAVVAGHALAILMAHRIALRLHASPRGALMSQLPLAALMVGYTLFGLWLLATPRGA